MKKTIRLFVPIFVFTLCFTNYAYSEVSIYDVQIIPEHPMQNDVIEIKVLGMFSHIGPSLDESIYTPFNKQLQLDLFFTDHAGPTIPEPWTHVEEIGTLVLGNYDLTVEAYCRSSPEFDYVLKDTIYSDFTVVPEPTSILILTLGALFIRYRSKSN